MNFFKIAIVVALAVIFNVFLFGKAEAEEEPKIFINEVMWQGRSSQIADEWVELYNNSDEIVDLSGYSIIDKIKSREDPNADPLVEIEEGQIAPKGYFLISRNKKDFTYGDKESYLDVEPDIVSSKLSLSNTKLKIVLRDSDGEEIDPMGGTDADNAGLEDKWKPYQPDGCEVKYCSLQRIDYSPDSGKKITSWAASMERKNLDEESMEFATPGTYGKVLTSLKLIKNKFRVGDNFRFFFDYQIFDPLNEIKKIQVKLIKNGVLINQSTQNIGQKEFVFPFSADYCSNVEVDFLEESSSFYRKSFELVCYQTSDDIRFSEVLSSPKDHDWDKNGTKESSDEWFELYNSSKTDCDLSGWYVLDESGKKYVFDRTIEKGQFLVFYSSVTKISLNNSGEELYLYDPSGKPISQVKIPSLAYNISYSFIDGQWYKTSVPTPNAKNVKDEEEEDSQVTSSADEKEKTFSSITRTNQSSMGNAESVVIKKVIVRKISYNNASVYLKRKNEALVPKMDGAIVLGASSERRYNPFNPKVFLLYLLAVLLLTSVFTYAFYRRE